jgi:hypothetical protein
MTENVPTADEFWDALMGDDDEVPSVAEINLASLAAAQGWEFRRSMQQGGCLWRKEAAAIILPSSFEV